MDLDVAYRSDLQKEIEGVPVDFGDGAVLTIAAWGNDRFQRTLEALTKPLQFQMEQGTLPASKNKEIMDQVIAETIVTGMEGVKVGGQPVEYSPQAVRTLIADPKYHRFREAIIVAAKEQEAYKETVVAETAKN